MNSKEEIRQKLKTIASNRNLTGEAIDVIIDLLTYSLYHEQVEIASTAKEMSLNDAVLVNSKISLCCDYMYSVYRGRNPRVKLMIEIESPLNKSKFEKIYETNTFKLYAEDTISLVPDGKPVIVTGIISHKNIIDFEVQINTQNMYYVDVIDSSFNPFSDLSEDIIVSITSDSINGEKQTVEYKTTRIFSDHCKSYGDDEKIFVLTIPGYGIRLFKKDLFQVNSTVNVKVIPYTTIDDINQSELSKIVIPGTVTIKNPNEYTIGDDINYLDSINEPHFNNEIYNLVDTVHRQDSKSMLYEANFAGRVNHEIQSNSDVSYLFNEVFIDVVESSTYEYIPEDNSLKIYYIEKENAYGSVDPEYFYENYTPYFITGGIVAQPATPIDAEIRIGLVTSDTINIYDQVKNLLSKYERKLDITLNDNQIMADIIKLDNVQYIKDFNIMCTKDGVAHEYPLGSGIDSYYVITLNIKFYKE